MKTVFFSTAILFLLIPFVVCSAIPMPKEYLYDTARPSEKYHYPVDAYSRNKFIVTTKNWNNFDDNLKAHFIRDALEAITVWGNANVIVPDNENLAKAFDIVITGVPNNDITNLEMSTIRLMVEFIKWRGYGKYNLWFFSREELTLKGIYSTHQDWVEFKEYLKFNYITEPIRYLKSIYDFNSILDSWDSFSSSDFFKAKTAKDEGILMTDVIKNYMVNKGFGVGADFHPDPIKAGLVKEEN